jgi:hypothetical protein
MKQSKHSKIRCQQRGIPREVHRWLDEFGMEKDAGHGAVNFRYVRLVPQAEVDPGISNGS